VTVPVSSIGGWYDIFLPGQLRDFQALQTAGRPARLTVGPWVHGRPDGTPMREAVEFGLACARGEEPPPRLPVRLFVMGEEAWRDFDAWPPSGYEAQRFHLRAGAVLSGEPPAESAPDRYRYDPADRRPRPAASGWAATPGVSTTPGWKPARMWSPTRPPRSTRTPRSSARSPRRSGSAPAFPSRDVFVRLCDVDPRGRSVNVCDGLISLTGADELQLRHRDVVADAHRFERGHRIRVQVSSGAFPRYARNPGTGSRTPPPPSCAPPTRRSTTTPSTPRPSSCRCAHRMSVGFRGPKDPRKFEEDGRNAE